MEVRMSLIELVKKTIFFESEKAGLNQSEIARKYGLTPQAVNLLLAGKRDFAKIELATFVRMFPNAQIVLNRDVCGNPGDTVYMLGDKETANASGSDALAQTSERSLFDRAMLEEWDKLDQQDKCRVMGFIAQLETEKKSDGAASA
jgi:transcriptional regulator with XRE-family HTH domain